MVCVEVKWALVRTAAWAPAGGDGMPSRVYVWRPTRAMTPRVNSWPVQNWGTAVGRLATLLPGIHAAGQSQPIEAAGRDSDYLINTDSAPPTDMTAVGLA